MFQASHYLDLEHTDHKALFELTCELLNKCSAPSEQSPKLVPVWSALLNLAEYIQNYFTFRNLSQNPEKNSHHTTTSLEGVTLLGQPYIGEQVSIGEGTVIEHGAMIKGPAIIGKNCQIRNGCYIRENVIVGNNVVLGNSCEFKNSVIFDDAQIPHFNYVGDSILGYKSHLGAGVILSNVKLDHSIIDVEFKDENGNLKRVSSGLRKFGAVIGDYAEVGCNSVLNPGSVIGRNALIYPGAQWRGVLPASTIAKVQQTTTLLRRREKKS